MNKNPATIRHEAECDEGWDDEKRGRVKWRTLFSKPHTPTEGLTAGVAEFLPGDRLAVHRHAPPEVYYFLAGEGVMTIEGEDHPVKANTAVFVPGNAAHGLHNTGRETIRLFYVFAADSFDEVEYHFPQ